MSKLRIAEIFSSLQGEGGWVGTPSVFVRVSGCNLRCRWCDTPYASWDPEGEYVEVAEIVERVLALGCDHTVLTGGEPMLFDPIEDLAKLLKKAGKTITIETAGTVFRDLPCDLISISPKLSNSSPAGLWGERHESLRLNREPLKRLVEAYQYQFKFVVSPMNGGYDADMAEIAALLDEVGVPRTRVMLMAEGTDVETLRLRQKELAAVCLKEGYRLTPRLHIELYGNRRGT